MAGKSASLGDNAARSKHAGKVGGIGDGPNQYDRRTLPGHLDSPCRGKGYAAHGNAVGRRKSGAKQIIHFCRFEGVRIKAACPDQMLDLTLGEKRHCLFR